MASLNNSRTLFGFTSPRTIEKIIPEIGLLAQHFDGQEWNPSSQEAFFRVLFASEAYAGSKMPTDPAMAARDRITRAPKALGFVDLKPVIGLTPAGRSLLGGKRIHERITKQLLKFQLPSSYHTDATGRYFVRPYLELLRMVNELGGLSKTEIALFFLQLTHIREYAVVVKAVRSFRERSKTKTTSHKIFVRQCFEEEIERIYSEEIASGDIATRESKDVSFKKFVDTKQRNMVDYADAFIRYMRATSLVTLEKRTFRLIIAPSKQDEVEYILVTTPREPIAFASEEAFKSHLFSATNTPLLTDNETLILDKLARLGRPKPKGTLSLERLKDLLEDTETEMLARRKAETTVALKDFKEYDDIIEVFDRIQRKDIIDPSLFLEWNVWRAFVMLNYAKETTGHFTMDLDGMPVNTAPGKVPDIVVDYGDFGLIVEVTMSSGAKQYEMEGEPVARHFGRVREQKENLYCLFIAPTISDGALAHYFNLNKNNTRLYGGKTRIVPLNVKQFVQFLGIAKENRFNDPGKLERWLHAAWTHNQACEDEVVWLEHIAKSLSGWAA